MTLPNHYDLTIHQGATLKRFWALRYPDGTIANLTTAGYTTGRLTVRDQIGGTVLLSLTTSNGGVVIDYAADANGRFWSGHLYCSALATAELEPWGEGVYDFEVSDGIDVIRVMEGTAVLSPEVTD
jgi:hypothetical protein